MWDMYMWGAGRGSGAVTSPHPPRCSSRGPSRRRDRDRGTCAASPGQTPWRWSQSPSSLSSFSVFGLPHFYNCVLTSCFCNFTECLKSVPVHRQDHSAVGNLLLPVGQGRSSSKAFYSEHRVPSKGCSHGCRQLQRRL